MAAYGSSASATTASGTSVTITKPSSLAAGDLMVAFISEENSGGTPNTPSGWTLVLTITDIAIPGIDTYVFAKVADSGDAAASDFTFTYSGSNTSIGGILYRITGTFASAANIYAYSGDATGTDQGDDDFRFSPGVTPSVASSLLIMHVHAVLNTAGATPSTYALQTSSPSWTEDHDIFYNGTETLRIAAAHATRTEVTDTGYFQITFNTASGDVNVAGGILLAISDTQNGTPTIAVIDTTLAVQAPAASGGSSVTAGVINSTLAVQAPTVTGGTDDALWKNTDKPTPGSITNTDKP